LFERCSEKKKKENKKLSVLTHHNFLERMIHHLRIKEQLLAKREMKTKNLLSYQYAKKDISITFF
jgi:hypothetical protein